MLKVKDCNLHKYNKKANNDDIFRTNRQKMKKPDRLSTIGLPKNRSYLLSQLVGQYHRRG